MATTIKNTMIEVGGGLIVPVALKGVKESQEIAFDREAEVEVPASAPKGKKAAPVQTEPIRRHEVGADTGAPVEKAKIRYGVYDEEGKFRAIPQEEIDAIAAAVKLDTLVVDEFVPIEDVPHERIISSYFLTPVKGQSPKPLKLLAEAMKPIKRGEGKRTARAGVCKVMLRTKQSLAMIYPKKDGLYLSVMHWSEDFAQAAEAESSLAGVEVNPQHLEMARELVTTLTQPIDVLDAYVDDARKLRIEAMERARAGKPGKKPVARPAVRPSDNLMAQLEASLADAAKKRGKVAT